MSFFGDFRRVALERGEARKAKDAPQSLPTTKMRKRTVALMIAFTAFSIFCVFMGISLATKFGLLPAFIGGPSGSTSSADYSWAAYGVHLDKSGQIDNVYSNSDLRKLSFKQLNASNVVLFQIDDNWQQSSTRIDVPTSVTVDGVSHPFDTNLNARIDTLDSAIHQYNQIVKLHPQFSLRGQKDLWSLGQFLLDQIISPTISQAIEAGQLTAPSVTPTGNSSLFYNESVATAYKDGVSSDAFTQGCDPNSGPDCRPIKATYDFSCKTVDIDYPDWTKFVNQAVKFGALSDVQFDLPGVTQLNLDTPQPCRILLTQPDQPVPPAEPRENPAPPQPSTTS
jgi:hypothetical protein